MPAQVEATALTCILPVTIYLLRRAIRGWGLTRAQSVRGFAVAAPVMLVTIALSFWLTAT